MILLDANVLSETMRPDPAERILAWIEAHDAELCLSAIVIAELVYGTFKVRPDQRSPRWEKRLTGWRRRFRHRTFAFDGEAADIYGRIMGRAKLAGRPMEPADGMIAATALRHRAAVATRNVSHFRIDGLTVVDPWTT